MVDGLIGRDVVDKQADILVDGLPGYLLATDMAGDSANDVRRALLVVIDTGEHDLVVEYGDAVETFDENVDGMMAMLESIRVETAHREGARVTRIGTFGLRFSDVQHHRFATEIMFLASRDLLQGYTSEHFGPEDPVTRAQALRLAVDSWNRFQDEQAGDRRIAVAEVPPAAASASGAAAVPSWCSAYVAAARERGLSWVGSDVFAGAASVTLVEGLRLLLEIYDIPLWQGSGGRLWKPVMDKGYELHLIPRGLADRNQRLTNAEMAALVQAMYVQMQIR